KSVLIIEKATFGGQITYSPRVENYPAVPDSSGNEIAEKLVDQVLSQGAEIELSKVLEIRDGDTKTVVTEDGEYECKAVIIATGARHRMLGIAGEEKLVGEGISFCAVCDGAFYNGKEVAVVGGGNSALQEALLLCENASRVTVIQNLPYLTGEKRLADRLYANEKATVLLSKTVKGFVGEDSLSGVIIADAETGEEQTLKVDGLFVAIGLVPQNEPFANLLALNDYGYADAEEDCRTKTEGVFVAGDCRQKRIRQVTTAVADGAVAALAACDYIDNL
ncbi:MAG: FAD-dependent oxidoreductase, partial [Acutalibacteraceae bacterium]|nr:FAD-dependent oxidoreductase [Acutalibacteraceae bacterium]